MHTALASRSRIMFLACQKQGSLLIARYQYGFCDVWCVPYTMCTCKYTHSMMSNGNLEYPHVHSVVHADDNPIPSPNHYLGWCASAG